MEPYVTQEYYEVTYCGDKVPDDKLESFLTEASSNIDTLTFNRIRDLGGIENLTPFQQEVVRNVCCKQADFLYENADMINTVLSGYSINGVSMNFGSSWNVVTENGVAISRSNYEHLQQTGLCCRLL